MHWESATKPLLSSTYKTDFLSTSIEIQSHLEVLEGATELLQAAAGRSGGGKEGLCIWQELLQLLQAAPVEMPMLHQPLHQGVPLVCPLHRPLPVLPELGKLQDEVTPGYKNTIKFRHFVYVRLIIIMHWLHIAFLQIFQVVQRRFPHSPWWR